MKKILILTAAFGDGHNTAARNIRDALEHVCDDVKVEVLDLFETSYGAANTLAKKAYLGMVQYAPQLWGSFYSLMENPVVERNLGSFTRLANALEDIVHETQPDAVVSTYPVYGHVIRELYRDHAERPFRFITVITDSISVNSAWYRAPSDFFCVPNEATADVLRSNRIPEPQIKALGFPTNLAFAQRTPTPLTSPVRGVQRRILYIINTGKKHSGKAIDRLLDLPDTYLTVTVGRDPGLKAKLIERSEKMNGRVNILGWTNQMPQLMLSNHLVIGKAGGATVQEAIAARCPMIVNQVIPGQEEGNARLIKRMGLGAVAKKDRQVADWVEEAFAHRASLWTEWRRNLERISKPDASLRIAELILAECDRTDRRRIALFEAGARPSLPRAPSVSRSEPKMLLCDFHIHTNYSDGKLTVPELIDFYGHHGFDCICITDHLADPRRLIGKLSELANFSLGQNQVGEYFEVLEQERRRAWRKYGMLVMTGLEFNKDGYTRKSSAHLLGIDLKAPVDPSLDLAQIIKHIHSQDGLAVASHPHIMKSEWGKNTLYLWENQGKFAPLIDAWEIANRNNIFTPIGLKNLSFIANSDFHKPKHIYSWKTLLHCPKEPEAIKDCIRGNHDVAITLYRDLGVAPAARRGFGAARPADPLAHASPGLPQIVNS